MNIKQVQKKYPRAIAAVFVSPAGCKVYFFMELSPEDAERLHQFMTVLARQLRVDCDKHGTWANSSKPQNQPKLFSGLNTRDNDVSICIRFCLRAAALKGHKMSVKKVIEAVDPMNLINSTALTSGIEFAKIMIIVVESLEKSRFSFKDMKLFILGKETRRALKTYVGEASKLDWLDGLGQVDINKIASNVQFVLDLELRCLVAVPNKRGPLFRIA